MSVKLTDILKDAVAGDEVASRVSNYEATALAEADRLGIFTRMYFVLARKPE